MDCISPKLERQNNTYYVLKTVCDANASWQRWIWTKNDQLMHVDTLKCLQSPPYPGLYLWLRTWLLFLVEWTSTETKQIWQCQGLKSINFWSNTSKLYMYQEFFTNDYVYGININNYFISEYTKWRRFPSGQSLCSNGKFQWKIYISRFRQHKIKLVSYKEYIYIYTDKLDRNLENTCL